MIKINIRKRLESLLEQMHRKGIDLYVIPMNDYHGSEYIGEYFKCVSYFSGFTGSAGTLVLTQKECCLFTDGRYFLQAGKQLEGTGIRLQKMGQPSVPSIQDYIVSYLSSGKTEHADEKEAVIGFDERLVSASFVKKIEDAWKKTSCAINGQCSLRICSDIDLAGQIWESDEENKRPPLSGEPVWVLPTKYTGKDTVQKLSQIREEMKRRHADVLILTTLDDIAWVLNLRGRDIAYNPVFLSYMIITKKKAYVYMRNSSPQIRDYLGSVTVMCKEYDRFYDDLSQIKEGKSVWVDDSSASYAIVNRIPAGCRRVKKPQPVLLMKAVKNPVEIEHEKLAHRKDAVAVTKLLYWLKTRICTGMENTTELGVAQKLEKLRKRQEHYLGQSFAPIVAYGGHGAIVHYEPKKETDVLIRPDNFLLLDTGGHYLEGTTDITRTVAMGPLSKEQKTHYTAVLQGNLRLADACFKHGMTGVNLDYIAREPLYRLGLDYRHGTGHGVGYLLNVHEGPNAFRQRAAAGDAVFEEGMITSDEPGVYLEEQYGIRLENLILCQKASESEYGTFLRFVHLTLVPFDREAIDPAQMSAHDIALLNSYHEEVYRQISPYLTSEEKEWLRQETRPI